MHSLKHEEQSAFLGVCGQFEAHLGNPQGEVHLAMWCY